MAKDKSRTLTDAATAHHMYLQRVAESYGNDVVKIIGTSEKDLLKFLETRLDHFGAVRPDLKTNAKFAKIQKGVSEIRRPAIVKARAYVSEELTVLAENEAVFAQKSTESLLKDISLNAVPLVILNQIVKHGIFSGATVRQMFNDLTDNDITRIMSHVRTGMTQGLDTMQIVRGLRGTAKANYMDGLLSITDTHARTITRTCTNGVANSAKMAFYSKNSDVIAGFKFSAMLDGRTSNICAAMDGTVWKNPEEAAEVKTPPLHHNALIKNTLITTRRGLIPIQDVKVGDYVLTHNNRWRKVYIVMSRKKTGTYRELINNFGERICLTHEHPILTINGWKNAGEVNIGDVVFQNPACFSHSQFRNTSPDIEDRVLLNAHNIKTETTEELVSYGIFSSSRGMTSAVNLKNCIADTKINYKSPYGKLDIKRNIGLLKKTSNNLLVKGQMLLKELASCFCRFFKNFNIINRVVFSHGDTSIYAILPESFRICSTPMRFSWFRNKLCVGNNRFAFVSGFQTVLNRKFTDTIIGKPVFSFKIPQAFSSLPMLFDKLFTPFKVHFFYNSSKYVYTAFNKWKLSTTTTIAEHKIDDYVYNLAIEDDETYCAGSFLVHNCRSSIVPVVKGFEKMESDRPAASSDFMSDAEKRYNAKIREKGLPRRWEDLSPSTRDKYYYDEIRTYEARTGKKPFRQVSTKTSFSEWFADMPASFQREWLGPVKYKLYSEGNYTIDKFVNKNTGKPYTIDDLKKMDKKTFK